MIDTIVNIISIAFCVILTYVFYDVVLTPRNTKTSYRILLGVIYTIVYSAYNIVTHAAFTDVHESFCFVILSFLMQTFFTYLCALPYKDPPMKKLFMAVLLMILLGVSGYIAMGIMTLLDMPVLEAVEGEGLSGITANMVICIVATLMIAIIKLIFNRSNGRPRIMHVLVFFMICNCEIFYLIADRKVLFGQSDEFVVRASAFFSLVLVLCVFYLFDRLMMFQSESTRLGSQIREQTKQSMKIDKNEEHIMSVQHDMKNHMQVIRSMIDGGGYDSAVRYIDDLGLDIAIRESEEDGLFDTGNIVIDSLIHSKQLAAEANGIKFSKDVIIPENLEINNVDISILLGNLLDNAIEGCLRSELENKFIDVKLRFRNSYLVCVVKNSSQPVKSFTGSIGSSKPNPAMHGIGRKNIRRIVNKYNGEINEKYENDTVIVELVIFISKSA